MFQVFCNIFSLLISFIFLALPSDFCKITATSKRIGVVMSNEKIFARVEEALSKGALWRAKEILQGNIPNGYNHDLYEKYGQVLLQMGDLLEAGKYLFLSGKTHSDYESAIALYLNRYTKSDPSILFNTFPKVAKLRCLTDYPKLVEQYLRSVNYCEKTLEEIAPQPYKLSRWDKAKGVFYLVIFIIVLSFIGHLIWSFLSYLFSIFTSP